MCRSSRDTYHTHPHTLSLSLYRFHSAWPMSVSALCPGPSLRPTLAIVSGGTKNSPSHELRSVALLALSLPLHLSASSCPLAACLSRHSSIWNPTSLKDRERHQGQDTMQILTTVLTLGFAAFLAPRAITAQEVSCWAPDGETLADNTTYVPCNKLGIQQEGVYSTCCNLDGRPGERDLCTTTGLCLNNGVLHRGYCTDKTWDSPACVNVCTDDNVRAQQRDLSILLSLSLSKQWR